MANNLTGLIPTIYAGLNRLPQDLIGLIPNVSTDVSANGAAIGQTVRSPVVSPIDLEDIVAGTTVSDTGSHDLGSVDVTITKSKAYPIRWTGEEELSVNEHGQYNRILADQFSEAFRTLANAVENDLADLYKKSARAIGTAGTTPFATSDNHTDWAEANRILDELGAPQTERSMIVGSAARSKIEGVQAGLFRVNEAGDAGAMLRDREMRKIHGFTMGYSAGIKSHTKGTGSGYLINNAAGYAIGDTDLALDTGTGTVLAGDVVTFDGDANKYLAGTDLAGGSFTINESGLAVPTADNTAATIGNGYTANMFFHRSALLLAARTPAMPAGGDSADDVMSVTDPVSGLTFQIAMYRLPRMIKYEIGLAWGVNAPNSKFSGVLMG